MASYSTCLGGERAATKRVKQKQFYDRSAHIRPPINASEPVHVPNPLTKQCEFGRIVLKTENSGNAYRQSTLSSARPEEHYTSRIRAEQQKESEIFVIICFLFLRKESVKSISLCPLPCILLYYFVNPSLRIKTTLHKLNCAPLYCRLFTAKDQSRQPEQWLQQQQQ